jgi:two-component system, sensor histidine kinase
MSINFSKNELQKVFPFYVLLDRRFLILDCGPSIEKMIGDLRDFNFNDQFIVIRPNKRFLNEAPVLEELINELIIIESTNFPVKTRFRGQLIHLSESDQVLFIGNPWLTDQGQLNIYNLTFSDFALSDTLPDLFNVLKSKEIVQADLTNFADQLIIERNKLLEKNREIEVLAKFQEQNPQPVLRVGFDGELLFCNQSASDLVKYSPFDNEDNRKHFYAQFIEGKNSSFELDIEIDQAIYTATCVPVVEEGYFNLYLKDISEIIQYQKEIENVNNQLATLINSMRSGLLVEDLHRKIVMVNEQFCNLFQIPYPKDQMVGYDCELAGEQAKVLFNDEVGFIDFTHKAIREKKNVFGEQLILKDGRIFERDYIPLIKEGSIQGHIWKYDDITEVIRSKESLQRVEEKYKKIIEELQFGLLEVDLEQRITKAFPAFCQMTGYEENELIGQFANHVLGLPDEIDKIRLHNEKRKNGETGVYETRIQTKSGDIKWVIISGSPILSASGNVIGSIGIHIDITERKRLETELVEAQKKAYSHVKAKDMFVTKISHEIRTPMNVIIGLADILHEMDLAEEQSKILSSIRLSAANLLGIISDVLDFSTLENNQSKLIESDFDPSVLLSELHEIFNLEAKKKSIQLISDCDSSVSQKLIGDKLKINQVLVNLIGNALKFTENGFVKISLRVINSSDEFQRLRFEVEDTGIGIISSAQKEIFSEFKQEDDSISVNYGGSGLGLAISSKIISKMGGEIKLISEKKKGSIFYFDLDFKINLTNRTDEIKTEQTLLDPGLKLLIAEDNIQNQLLIRTLFNKSGLSVEIVENGQEVLTKLDESDFDLILMDIQMPILNGLDTLLILRKMKNQIPVIALTANASEQDRKVYLEAGFDDVVIKPYKKNELFSKIFNILNHDKKVEETPRISTIDAKNDFVSFSVEEVKEIVGDDKELLKELVATFLDNTPKLIKQIVDGSISRDKQKVEFAIHQIKPSLKIFKVNEMLDLLSIIEEIVKSDFHSATLADKTKELEVKFSMLETEINIHSF